MHSRLKQGLVGATAAIVLAGGAAIGFMGGDDPRPPTPIKVTTSTTTAPPTKRPAKPAGSMVADAVGAKVDLYREPNVAYEEKPWLDNPTHEGLYVVFLVLEDKGEWLKVRVSARPNGLVAWIKRDQVALRTVPNRVLIEVGARRVTVFHGDEILLQETVAVGTDRTPTPLGRFFVDGIVQVPYDTGPYGAYQVSVSGFSEVLKSFDGGVGQIAMHGTNRPDLLGQPVSNGCIRLSNAAITKMAELAPNGTSVEIVA